MKPATSELRDIWKERKEPQVRTTSVHHVRWNDPRRPEGRKRLGGWPLWLLWLQRDVMNGDGDAAIQERIVGQDLWDAEALGALIGGVGRERHSLANVFPSEDDATGLAFETANVPLLVQCQE